jgi:hypothetical protein
MKWGIVDPSQGEYYYRRHNSFARCSDGTSVILADLNAVKTFHPCGTGHPHPVGLEVTDLEERHGSALVRKGNAKTFVSMVVGQDPHSIMMLKLLDVPRNPISPIYLAGLAYQRTFLRIQGTPRFETITTDDGDLKGYFKPFVIRVNASNEEICVIDMSIILKDAVRTCTTDIHQDIDSFVNDYGQKYGTRREAMGWHVVDPLPKSFKEQEAVSTST